MVMDVNLTSPITASVDLTQSWWIPVLSAVISGGMVLLGAYIGARTAINASHQEALKEQARVSREERKAAYIKYLELLNSCLNGVFSSMEGLKIFDKKLSRAMVEVRLFGSQEVLDVIMKDRNSEDTTKDTTRELYQELAPIMAKELQELGK